MLQLHTYLINNVNNVLRNVADVNTCICWYVYNTVILSIYIILLLSICWNNSEFYIQTKTAGRLQNSVNEVNEFNRNWTQLIKILVYGFVTVKWTKNLKYIKTLESYWTFYVFQYEGPRKPSCRSSQTSKRKRSLLYHYPGNREVVSSYLLRDRCARFRS